ncbi:eukaryotic translation initiation factor 4 gamma 1-like isoform X2 [Acropora muricata]|uniref:eukaryotic translation initiation factor 4 gamma 1-like isoform X2 n=1 Tax=Acropora muricata TaxID=159855 RepID=UPI0034E607C2
MKAVVQVKVFWDQKHREMIKTEEKVEPDESEKPVATDALPVSESKTLNGPTTTISHEQAGEETEKVTTINSEVDVETTPAPDAAVAVAPEPSKAPEDDVTTQNEETTQGSEEPEVLPPSSHVEEASGMEKVNGHDDERKASPASKTDSQVTVATKEMKKKKQKHRIKEIEKRSSEKEMDMMDAYTDKPVQEQVPDQAEEEPVEDTTQTQHEETTEDAPSDDETWEDKEDACFPDLEDASDARPDGAKLTYGRDFLLQFQTNPLSMMKPEGLPDIDVVLVQARPPSKSGSQQNRMPKGDGGENMFLPSYMRQMSKGNPSGSRSGRNRNVTTKKVIELPSMQQQPDLKRVDNRWVRPSEVTKGGNEEEAKTQELFHKVRGILKKLTPQKFQTLTQQIIDLDIDTQERLEGAIDLIFAKAIDEATFSVAYAKMCQFLVSENKKVVVEKDGVKKDISFHKILLNRCQKEFEKENSIEKTINEKLADLVNQGLNEEELQKRKSDLEDQVHQAKRRTLGNIRFIGELFKLKMLTESIMHDCVVKLLRSNDEESFECLCKLLVTIGKDLDHEKAKPRVDQYFAQINKIISAKITSSRVRFMMQDIVDLRNNNWVPRREDNNPKTIDHIHKEAADQAKKTQIKIQMAKQERKLQRGNMGGRDSARPGSLPQADESWTTVGKGGRNMSLDPEKFQNLKRQVDSENISLGPGGRGYGSWARGSSGGTGSVGAGAGPSAAVTAGSSVAGSVAEPDNRPANRFSALSSDRKHSAPTRGNFGDSRRQEPRSPVSGGGRRGAFTQGEREKAVQAVRAAMQPKLKRVDNRWVRPSEVTKGGNEEEAKTQELFRKVRGILNVLTPQKFQTLAQQIIDLDIDTQERLEGAIDLIFVKAIDEATFSVAYAKMCQFLVSENKKVVVEKDGVKKDISFHKILLNRCQKEFEKENSVKKTINEKLADLVNQGLNEEELQKRKSDLEDQVHQAKRRTLGNIRFIGELFKLKMLTESIMHDCVVKLLRSNDEESFECLCKLLVTIGKDLDHEKAKPRFDQYFAQINKIISAKITSSRVRFMMQDIVDLRNNNWVPRREDNNPKTIDQIHKEAADQAKKTQIKIQMAKQERKLQRGNMGGRDSARPGSLPQADESWTTVGRGRRNMSLDPVKFQNLKRQVDSENIPLGPGGRGYGSWARGSSGGTGSVGAGAGPSAAVTAGSSVAGSVAEPDNRPANRFSALSSDRKHSAPTRGNFGDSRRQEPRSPVSGGGRRGAFTQGEREKAVQAVRAAMQPKRTSQEREGARESPRTTGEASPAAGSSSDVPVDGSVNSSTAPEVTKKTMKKKTLSIIDEFLNIRDMKEVAECLKEIWSPSRHHVFVEVTFNHTMEKRMSERQLTGKLIHFLLRDGVLTSQQYLDGLDSVFEVAEDTEIDTPQLWKYLGELMGPSAFDGSLGLDVLFKCVFKHVQKHKAARLFACMLQSCEKSPEDVRAFLRAQNINLNIFFDDAEEAREFAKDKNIEYALGPASPSANQYSAKVEEELRNIILKRKARNEEVIDWIDENVSPSSKKGASFIRALVTVVCEIALEEEGEVCKCNIHKLKDRKNLLQKYIDANTALEVQALYAVQALFLRLDRPQGFVKSYFDSLYDEEIITEISFNTWESSVEEEPGKGVTVMAASEFFRWLRSATEENDEES